MWRRFKQVLRENWGAPFFLVFILLIALSAIYLGLSNSSATNSFAEYAFYALVLGLALQIASRMKFGESKQEEILPETGSILRPSIKWRRGRKMLALFVIIVIILASGFGTYHYKPTKKTNTTSRTNDQLMAGINFITTQQGPNNSESVMVGINQTGGLSPFNFTAYWSDGFNQTNEVGVFTRSFLYNESIPDSLIVNVSSSDGQTATVIVKLPSVNRTFTTTSSTVSTTSSSSTTTNSTTQLTVVTFAETGLPAGSTWYLYFPGSTFQSNTSKMTFTTPLGYTFNYTISGPYDTKNYGWAFIPSPESGSFIVNGSTIINSHFLNQTINIPSNQILTLATPIVATSTASHSEQIEVDFHNAFPAPVEAIVFATVTNNESRAVSISTAGIGPNAFANDTAVLLFDALSSGNYTVSLFAESSSGVILSRTIYLTFTIP